MRHGSGRVVRCLLALVLAMTLGCNGTDPGDDPDAGPEAGLEASVRDVEVPPDVRDARVGDARPDSEWCGANPFPGVDPNAQELISDAPAVISMGFSWDGSRIAYSRAAPGPAVPSMDYEVYLFEMDTWQEIQITFLPDSWQRSPTMSAGQIIWTDGRYRTIGVDDYRFELVVYDIDSSQEARLTDSPDKKTFPRFNGRYLAYDFFAEGTGTGELRLLDLVTSDDIVLSPVDRASEGFSISSRFVTWVAMPPNAQFYNKDVHIYDLQTQQTLRLESTAGDLTYETSVSGSKVAWADFRHGQWDVYLYDIEAGQETRLTDDPFDQGAPAIHGNLVTFSDFRFTGGYLDGYCARDIYILDIDTMIGRRVTTLPWYWWGMPGDDGWLLAILRDELSLDSPAKLYLFDLIAMGILDPTGQHVLPGP
ncbi:MAG: hypothetical protein ABI333_12430 [bacterium]